MSEEQEKKPEPLQINGITEQDFIQWKHHPATRAFRKYMKDFAKQLSDDHVERWRAGVEEIDESEARGRVLALEETASIEFEHMAGFYEQPIDEEEEENEGPTDQ